MATTGATAIIVRLDLKERTTAMLQNRKDRQTAVTRSWHALMLRRLALVASIALFGSSAAGDTDPQFEKWSLRPMCALWDGQASKAIVHKVNKSRDDINLQRLGEDLSRMRRARRNCDIGMIRAACHDYLAVVRNIGGTSSEWRGSDTQCPTAMADDSIANGQHADAQHD